ncbi:prepilin peptidase [Vibrio sp. ZSDZ34]|uniref:Prepilin peptidase n=1 Tax=Vibrio gelatinilyticus TaxID=2893468 RepID=A0A9X1WBN3_9VIBR|nr:prepilin peptidase [Vibrio gelatinilyticus]MCJ2377106.1 prepilin peptidase [Vibrio gelatinilyticus]
MEHVSFWLILSVIVVFDVKENRIPNKWVVVLLGCSFLLLTIKYGGVTSIKLDHVYGGLVAFFGGLIFYILRAMAAGDVKLLGVVGFTIGLHELGDYSLLLILSGGFIGVYYLLDNISRSGVTLIENFKQYAVLNIAQRKNMASSVDAKLAIPFAPAIMLALLLLSSTTI